MRTISLTCDYSGAPGLSWRSVVEFRQLKSGGFSVWSNYSDDGESQGLRKVRHSSAVLTWRRAVETIQSTEELGLGGDLYDWITINGLEEGWQRDMLAMGWITDESPYVEQLPFLMGLPDEEIAYLHGRHGSLASGEAVEFLDELAENLRLAGLSQATLSDAAQAIGLKVLPPPDSLARAVEEYVAGRSSKFSAQIEVLAANYRAMVFRGFRGGFTGGMARESKVGALADYLIRYSVQHDCLPRGTHSIPAVGEVVLDEIVSPQLVDLLESLPVEPESIGTVLEDCVSLPPPPVGSAMMKVLDAWVSAAPKPRGSRIGSIGYSSEWSFLYWAVAHAPENGCAQFALHNSAGADALRDWVQRSTNALEEKSHAGTGAAAAFGRGIQSACRQLGEKILGALA